MKTPEEIKKGLAHCYDNKIKTCKGCVYYEGMNTTCSTDMLSDALTYIQQLEISHEVDEDTINVLATKVQNLESKLAQAERERDAAVADLDKLGAGCEYCAHFKEPCMSCCCGDNWQWRGVCPENTKEQKA